MRYLRYIEPIYRSLVPAARRSGTSVLELAVLGLLREQDLHGYELRRRLGEILGPIARLSFGTLYPALNRLDTNGAVAIVGLTGSRTGLTTARGRKVYRITEAGLARFDELLASGTGVDDDERSFALRLAFARYLPGEARMRLLVRRREQMATQLDQVRASMSTDGGRLDDYSRSLLEHRIDVTENDISWLDRLIAREHETRPNTESRSKNRE